MKAIKEHPWIIAQRELPKIPGYSVNRANHVTEDQAEELVSNWCCNLPAKGDAVYVNFHVSADFPLVRITRHKIKNQYNKTMFCIEFFKKENQA